MHARAGMSTASPPLLDGRRPRATAVPGGPLVLVDESSTAVTVPEGAVVVSAGAVEVVAAAFGAVAFVGARPVVEAEGRPPVGPAAGAPRY
jgi:hypothetical protein